jgi:TonB family protein
MVNYQSLLISQVFKSRAFNLSNSFSNPSLIKKRMIMMTKKRTSALASMKLLMVVPVLTLVFLAISACKENPVTPQNQTNIISDQQQSVSESGSETMPPPPPPEMTEESREIPFVVVEEMPKFPGGEVALLTYIADNTQYPVAAKEQNIQGRVIVRFCVTAEGGTSQISVLKGVAPELDAEAIRVVETLPSFKPGKQGGKPVPVWYMIPITFTLK